MSDCVWLVYDHNMGPYAISIHATAEAAAQDAARRGYGRVARWPLNTELTDAIREWEGR